MKRQAEEELLKDVAKYRRIQAIVKKVGDSRWMINQRHILNLLLRSVPSSDFTRIMSVGADPDCSLQVDGENFGPLKALDIERLMLKANPAPFGQGGETVLDTKVRMAYAIEGQRINLAGVEMVESSLFATLVGPTVVKLMERWLARPRHQFNVSLYKLHIYPKGGHFAPHRDTPHGREHIATVVVELPTEYTGDGLFIKHGEEMRSMRASTSDEVGQLKVAMFYTDCLHWVDPVESGHRIVMQFDVKIIPRASLAKDTIIVSPSSPGQADLSSSSSRVSGKSSSSSSSSSSDENSQEAYYDDDHPDIKGFLGPRINRIGTPVHLYRLIEGIQEELKASGNNVALLLQHCYLSSGGLTVNTLKGSDRLLWEALKEADMDPSLYACVVKTSGHYEEGYYHAYVGGIGFETDKKTLLITGANSGSLDEIMKQDGGLTGNEAMPTETTYLAAAIVVPAVWVSRKGNPGQGEGEKKEKMATEEKEEKDHRD